MSNLLEIPNVGVDGAPPIGMMPVPPALTFTESGEAKFADELDEFEEVASLDPNTMSKASMGNESRRMGVWASH